MNETILSMMSDATLLRMYFVTHAMQERHLKVLHEMWALYEELRKRGYDMCEVIDEARFLTAFGNAVDRKAFAENWDETVMNIRF